MTDLLRPKLLLFVLISLLLCQSCAEKKSSVSPKSSVQTSSQAANLAKKHMEAGEYQKAIDIYSDEYRKHPQDQSLIKEYAKSLGGIKSIADKRLEMGDLEGAGRTYYVLHNNYAKFRGVEQLLSFDNTDLNMKLSYCQSTLSKQGFEEYRKGNLNKAIVLWKGLLAIDPNNKAIREAVRTATQQQKNLQENK